MSKTGSKHFDDDDDDDVSEFGISMEPIFNPYFTHFRPIFFSLPPGSLLVGIKRQHWSAIWVSLLLVNVYLPNHFVLVTLLR